MAKAAVYLRWHLGVPCPLAVTDGNSLLTLQHDAREAGVEMSLKRRAMTGC
jgi:hypothetical protein